MISSNGQAWSPRGWDVIGVSPDTKRFVYLGRTVEPAAASTRLYSHSIAALLSITARTVYLYGHIWASMEVE